MNILLFHKLSVWIFLVFFLIKVVLMVAGQKALLDNIRAKTKVLDMILGTLVLVTGLWWAITTKNFDLYIILKLVLVLAAIPLGIVGFKKDKKVLVILSLLALLGAYGLAEAKKPKFAKPEITAAKGSIEAGKQIYLNSCQRCHGPNGNDGIGAAKDLTASMLSHEEKVTIISEGKGMMQKFKKELSKEEIESVANYVESLKK